MVDIISIAASDLPSCGKCDPTYATLYLNNTDQDLGTFITSALCQFDCPTNTQGTAVVRGDCYAICTTVDTRPTPDSSIIINKRIIDTDTSNSGDSLHQGTDIIVGQHYVAHSSLCHVVRVWQLTDRLICESGDKIEDDPDCCLTQKCVLDCPDQFRSNDIMSAPIRGWVVVVLVTTYWHDYNSDRLGSDIHPGIVLVFGHLNETHSHSVLCWSLPPSLGYVIDPVLPSSGSSIPLFKYGHVSTVGFITFGIEDGEILNIGENACTCMTNANVVDLGWEENAYDVVGWKEWEENSNIELALESLPYAHLNVLHLDINCWGIYLAFDPIVLLNPMRQRQQAAVKIYGLWGATYRLGQWR